MVLLQTKSFLLSLFYSISRRFRCTLMVLIVTHLHNAALKLPLNGINIGSLCAGSRYGYFCTKHFRVLILKLLFLPLKLIIFATLVRSFKNGDKNLSLPTLKKFIINRKHLFCNKLKLMLYNLKIFAITFGRCNKNSFRWKTIVWFQP